MKLPRFAIVMLLACAVAGCKKESARAEIPGDRKQDAVPVTVAPAVVAAVQRSVEVTGTLFGDEEATVSAKVPGRIVQILRDVGDRAASGEPLAQIDKTDYELAAAQKQMAAQASSMTMAKRGNFIRF